MHHAEEGCMIELSRSTSIITAIRCAKRCNRVHDAVNKFLNAKNFSITEEEFSLLIEKFSDDEFVLKELIKYQQKKHREKIMKTATVIILSINSARISGKNHYDAAQKLLNHYRSDLSDEVAQELIAHFSKDLHMLRVIIGANVLDDDALMDLLAKCNYPHELCQVAVEHLNKLNEYIVPLTGAVYHRNCKTASDILRLVAKKLDQIVKLTIFSNSGGDPIIGKALAL